MNRQFPVFTIENECQDCYKCVRHCHAKAIRIVNARAAVIPELCVSCGECVRVCPAHAKKIRSDLARVKQMLENHECVYASVAPSFAGFFRGLPIEKLAGALLKLGFTGVSETAHGAQLVSSAAGKLLADAPDGVYISSACPAAVDYIRKYLPEWTNAILPLDSPVMAHCKLLRRNCGNDIKTVFIGPCAAKKLEADAHPETLSLALTFESLQTLFDEQDIDLGQEPPAELTLGNAEEGRFYSIEGGMNDTLRDDSGATRYIALSGLEKISAFLRRHRPEDFKRGKVFIEVLACSGGCVNGPAMPAGAAGVETLFDTAGIAPKRTSLGREVPVDIRQGYFQAPASSASPNEAEIIKALESVGKFTKADELNCGGCGYDSCRDFACALIAGKAEPAMCHNFLRANYQRTSNALIRYIPAGVVIVDENLQILESNRHFAELMGEDSVTIFDNLGSLSGIQLDTVIDFVDLFESVLANGGEIEKFNQVMGDRIINISVFAINPGKTVGAVISDVTKSELKREKIAEKAKEVIRKNVLTVQQVARLFGEHIAQSEVLLEEIAGNYSAPPPAEEPQPPGKD